MIILSLLLAAQAADSTVCIDCHGKMPGRLGEAVTEWTTSVHHDNGVSCHDCHGGDPTDAAMAMLPERGFIGKPAPLEVPAFCARCHVGVAEDYLASVHGAAYRPPPVQVEAAPPPTEGEATVDAGATEEGATEEGATEEGATEEAPTRVGPNCVTCHGNHAIQPASVEIASDETCGSCHDAGRAVPLRALLKTTDERITAQEAQLTALRQLGFRVEDARGEIFAGRNEFHSLFHFVNEQRLSEGSTKVAEKLDTVDAEIATMNDERSSRKRWGGLVIGLLVLLGLLAAGLRRSLPE